MANFITRLLTHNWSLKLAAFGLALLLWTSVRVEAPNRQTLPGVPVRVELTDPEWALVDAPLPATVEVRFAGPSRELFRMALDRPSIVVPVDQVASGDTAVILRPQWVRIADRPGVTVEDIQPSSVRLRFEGIQRRALPVQLRLVGELPEGLALMEPILPDPVSVQVIAAASLLAGVDSIPLLPVDLSRITQSGPVSVPVDTAVTRGFQVAPGILSVRVVVGEGGERTLPGVPIRWPGGGLPAEWEVTESAPSVRISGALYLLDSVQADELWLEPEAEVLEEIVRAGEPGDSVAVPLSLRGVPPLVRGEGAEVMLRRIPPDGG